MSVRLMFTWDKGTHLSLKKEVVYLKLSNVSHWLIQF